MLVEDDVPIEEAVVDESGFVLEDVKPLSEAAVSPAEEDDCCWLFCVQAETKRAAARQKSEMVRFCFITR